MFPARRFTSLASDRISGVSLDSTSNETTNERKPFVTLSQRRGATARKSRLESNGGAQQSS